MLARLAGAVALARAVVESVAKDKCITKGNLESKIDQLFTLGYISEAMREAAREVRFAGNEVAHGDLVAEVVNHDDAEGIVQLMNSVLERVYQEPARVARIREKRENRKAKIKAKVEVPTPETTADDGFTDEPPF